MGDRDIIFPTAGPHPDYRTASPLPSVEGVLSWVLSSSAGRDQEWSLATLVPCMTAVTQQGALGAGCILPEDITSGGGDPSGAQRIFDAVGCLPHSPFICFLLLCFMSSVTSAYQK